MDQGDKARSVGDFLARDGEMEERTRSFDWSGTPVGPAAAWPQSLKIAVRIMLGSRYAMWLGWGPDFTFFYNDAYARMTLGPKHPWALGRSAREVWSEIWGDIGPRAESVVATGRATWDEGLLLFLERRGFPEETYHTFSYSPLPDDRGGVGGMLCVVTEDTERTIGERRLRTLRELAARTTDQAHSVEDACQTAARALTGNPQDVPFLLLYLLDADGRLTLAGWAGVEPGTPISPATIALLGEDGPWPFARAGATGRAVEVGSLPPRFGALPGGAWPEPSPGAIVLPMARPGQGHVAGFVVAGISPRRPLDDGYRGFLDLLAGQIAATIANARAYEEERRRAEKLAELDRAKTAFFSNISHEFRTPLTLMLGPVEDLLAGPAERMAPGDRALLEVVDRNGRRLLRLVNTLLDFSRIEAGRARACYEPTDLAAATAELASVFRAACDRAGLRLVVDCPPLAEPVFVDREMWEKIVLNLLSNAFKFTLEGEIAVALRRVGDAAELRIRDTGTGIPAEEMPRLFERFHRVENALGRTHEGSGIGLALVRELVGLHGGTVAAESVVGWGTTFVVAIPLGSAHLPTDRLGPGREPVATTTAGAAPFVEEVLRWLPDRGRAEHDAPPAGSTSELDAPRPPGHAGSDDDRPRVLLADDNTDMRDYVARLLAEHYRIEAVADGEAALEAARRRPPDLILTDVMMPRLDGFGLLRALRADPRTRGLPVLLLSARAGEESRVEGMEAGADDYLVKPFAARELLARVSAHIQMARLRREAGASLRRGEERLRMALAAARMVAWQYDPLTGEVVVSDNAADVFGLPPGSTLEDGEQGFALLHPDDAERHRAEIMAAYAARGSCLSEYRMIRPDDGSEIWLEERCHAVGGERGEPVILVGVVMDITERKRAEQALREGEARFRELADAMPQIVYVSDPGGRVVFVNRQWLDYTGQPDAQTADLGPVVHPEDRDGLEWRWEQAKARGTGFQAEFRLRRATDGEYRWFLTRSVPVRDALGRIVQWYGTSTDIHDHKRTEEALQEADRRKDEFLATLAHELRNPLAPIRNGLQIMRLAGEDGASVEEARTLMERQVTHMVRLIDDLMDVSRITRGKLALLKERVELATVIHVAVDTSRPLVEGAGHELIVTAPARPIYVEADVTRLAQVFSNLLNNAAKYTEPGGEIALVAERQGGEVVVTVRDNGVGIPSEMLPHVFDLFTQVDRSLERSQGGLGIGLTLVRQLVEMHGGSVEARSDGQGRGSEFVVRLPIVAARPARAVPAGGEPGTAGPVACRRILVVDDNRDAARTLARLLKLTGHEARTAHDGGEAVAVAEEYRPEVILLDIGLPVMNGYDVAREIRRRPWGQSVGIVALTGWGQEGDRRRSKEAGIDHHLVKPVAPAALEKLLAGLRPGTDSPATESAP